MVGVIIMFLKVNLGRYYGEEKVKESSGS